ncbi:hypothetical protein Cob_v008812 [Colletotrichum orbiculare MAFF 240422]|uniref:Uncharacterized protein n=1 Tax=Colletotrichum orbiculare (strain 104-T / ATCC 96160 / CBS 514.97 / LARS 414 / MAFF 240422) TaxID=1213857 RepID=A0A484FKK8_COLOR|nr:hypothetical protein Cob_v008812 [Colletotrichum orbiculare MAFF 240422]
MLLGFYHVSFGTFLASGLRGSRHLQAPAGPEALDVMLCGSKENATLIRSFGHGKGLGRTHVHPITAVILVNSRRRSPALTVLIMAMLSMASIARSLRPRVVLRRKDIDRSRMAGDTQHTKAQDEESQVPRRLMGN